MIKRHTKPTAAGQQGQIIEKEAPIQGSNVAIFNPNTSKADRVGIKVDGDTKDKKAKKYEKPKLFDLEKDNQLRRAIEVLQKKASLEGYGLARTG